MSEHDGRHDYDGRPIPFFWQTVTCTAVLRERFVGKRLTVALALYSTMVELANEARSREDFTISRARIAHAAGVSDRTVDSYCREFAAAGLLEVERQRAGKINLPNKWTLLEPGWGGVAKRLRQGGEAASPGGSEAASPLYKKKTFKKGALSAFSGTRSRGESSERERQRVEAKLVGPGEL